MPHNLVPYVESPNWVKQEYKEPEKYITLLIKDCYGAHKTCGLLGHGNCLAILLQPSKI